MEKTRLEAFSDGVIAIIITIMVLEIHVPETADRETVIHILPSLISNILSFLIIGIYWNNHHHLFLTVKKISSRIMWANLNFLFWLSLVPFATAWMGKTKFNVMTVVVYKILLLLNGFSFEMLRKSI